MSPLNSGLPLKRLGRLSADTHAMTPRSAPSFQYKSEASQMVAHVSSCAMRGWRRNSRIVLCSRQKVLAELPRACDLGHDESQIGHAFYGNAQQRL